MLASKTKTDAYKKNDLEKWPRKYKKNIFSRDRIHTGDCRVIPPIRSQCFIQSMEKKMHTSLHFLLNFYFCLPWYQFIIFSTKFAQVPTVCNHPIKY